MSDPIGNSGTSPYFYSCDRDPNASEPNAAPPFSAFESSSTPLVVGWLNTTSGDYFNCSDQSNPTNWPWQKAINESNLAAAMGSINQPRVYSAVASPAFSTSRRPSTTSDTRVVAGVTLTSVLLGSAVVTPQVSADNSTWQSLPPVGLLNVAGNVKNAVHLLVPASYYYRITSTVSGVGAAASLDSVFELSN